MGQLQELERAKATGCLLKGFRDAHLHLIEYGKLLDMCDLRQVGSIAEMIELLSKVRDAERIEAFGWNQENFVERRYPNRYDLDKIATDRPVLLSRICAHVTVVNSYVIAKMGLDESVPAVAGGQIDVDEKGKPTGLFRERARQLIYRAGFYDESIENVQKYILKAQADLISKGIVEVHVEDCKTFPNIGWRQIIDAYLDLERTAKLLLKVQFQANVDDLAALRQYIDQIDSKALSVTSVKRFSDGSLGARTAHLREPYSDRPDTVGIALQSDAELLEDFKRARDLDLAIVVHAIGDRAMERVIDAFAALNAAPQYLERCGIIHCQITAPDLIAKMAKLGIRGYIQPIFIHEDAKVVHARIGERRANWAYAFKSMRQSGIPLLMSSDAPIDTPDVIKGLHCAVYRRTLHDQPITYLASEGIALADAVADYTSSRDNAWVVLDMPLEQAIQSPHSDHIESVYIEDKLVYQRDRRRYENKVN